MGAEVTRRRDGGGTEGGRGGKGTAGGLFRVLLTARHPVREGC